jgi:hypothetical protein
VCVRARVCVCTHRYAVRRPDKNYFCNAAFKRLFHQLHLQVVKQVKQVKHQVGKKNPSPKTKNQIKKKNHLLKTCKKPHTYNNSMTLKTAFPGVEGEIQTTDTWHRLTLAHEIQPYTRTRDTALRTHTRYRPTHSNEIEAIHTHTYMHTHTSESLYIYIYIYIYIYK